MQWLGASSGNYINITSLTLCMGPSRGAKLELLTSRKLEYYLKTLTSNYRDSGHDLGIPFDQRRGVPSLHHL